ncbi:MAG: HDOD domain-containing protein [Pseudomonadota bacterium]
MKNWIARWLGPANGSEPTAPAAVPAAQAKLAAAPNGPPAATPAAPAAAPQVPPYSSADIDVMYYRLIAGGADHAAREGAEAMILDALDRLLKTPSAGANLVPRVPAVIPQLLRSLRDESVDGTELARQVAQDPMLVAEVIRAANSAYYAPAAPVKNIEGAVIRLGQNGLRVQVARVSFRPIINDHSGHFAHMAAPQIWRQSELCAQAATMLAKANAADPFEAYLAGLMHSVGLIVALRLIDQVYRDAALPGTDSFYIALGASARLLSARIAALWEFPPPVVEGIANMDANMPAPLAHTLALGDQLSKLRVLVDAGAVAADDPALLATVGAPAMMGRFDHLHGEDTHGV